MNDYRRYAVYYTPPPGTFADFGAGWLGWDAERGLRVEQPTLDGLDLPQLTEEPRKYGFHATLKAPFRLADGVSPDDLKAALGELASGLAPVTLPGLRLARIGPFFALVPNENNFPLQTLAEKLVKELDHLRAALTPEELARRRPERLSPRQRTYLDQWGYPYVGDEFRFHMTLSGPIDDTVSERFETEVKRRLDVVPEPVVIDAVSLMGEGPDKNFHLVERVPLSGKV